MKNADLKQGQHDREEDLKYREQGQQDLILRGQGQQDQILRGQGQQDRGQDLKCLEQEQQLRKQEQWVRVLSVLTVLTLLFIWGHSMIPADLSSEESAQFVVLINGLISNAGGSFSVTDHMVRKTAHFLEYAVLGGETALLLNLKYAVRNSLNCAVRNIRNDSARNIGNNTVRNIRNDTARNIWRTAVFGGSFRERLETVFFWISVPAIDEMIQYFTPGRACMIQDVILDMCGFAAGYTLLCVIQIFVLLAKKIGQM